MPSPRSIGSGGTSVGSIYYTILKLRDITLTISYAESENPGFWIMIWPSYLI
jgi:hypothetical protein